MAKILFLAHRVPFPPDKGDKIRAFHFLKGLSQRHEIWLGAGVDDPADLRGLAALQPLCREVFLAPLGALRRAANMTVGAAAGRPVSVARFAHPGLRRWVGRVLREVEPDVAFVSSSALGGYVAGRTAPGTRLVIDFVDADAEKWRAYAQAAPPLLRAVYASEFRRLVRFERRLLAAAAAGVLVSESERDVFAQLMPVEQARKLHVVPNGVDAGYFAPSTGPQAPGAPVIVFCGRMDYRPNVDGARWFATEVLPRVRESCPAAVFRIVGAAPGAEVRALAAAPHVEVTGAVDDVRPHLARAAVVVVPLRIARGIQNKLLEGLATGRPVVVTPQALEGVAAQPGRDLLTADDAEGFAAAVAAVLQGRAPGDLGANGRAFVLQRHAWAAHVQRLEALIGVQAGAGSAQAAA